MVLNTFFKLIKFNLQITFPTFPIKIYLLLNSLLLMYCYFIVPVSIVNAKNGLVFS